MLDVVWTLAAGFALGLLFYGGLWWTARRIGNFRQPALAVLGSALLRMTIVLGGFYWVGSGRWSNLLLCVLGFLLARLAVTWRARLPSSPKSAEARRAT